MREYTTTLTLLLFMTLSIFAEEDLKGPSVSDSPNQPSVRKEGDDALLTCIVRNQNNYTVMWRKVEKHKNGTKILTANKERITSDERISVLHETGGQVYVLLIKSVTVKDDGMYICEVNSEEPARSFHRLKVLSATLQPPDVHNGYNGYQDGETGTPDSIDVWGYSTANPINHDYTDCCKVKNVTSTCLGFCNIKNIMEGSTGINPTECEEDFPSIAFCMADGRDHTPCCTEVGIPLVCQDLCRGEYNFQSDYLKSHFSCVAHTAPTLACIAAGIDLLPGQPMDVGVSVTNESSVTVSWDPPVTSQHLIQQYVVNVTYLQFLSPVFSVTVDNRKAREIYPPFSTLHRVPMNQTQLVINGLEKFSLYSISMWSEGINGGHSLPTYTIKFVTQMEGEELVKNDAPSVPSLPDVQACCTAKNVSHARCVDKFCDPRNIDTVDVADMMICAPWDTEIFSCLADGRDHTPCCTAKQIPPVCQELCSGQVTDINFKYFRCLSYMSELSSCLMDGYGVLPSAPLNFRFSNIDTTFGILHWEPPAKLADTVIDYNVHFQVISPEFGERRITPHAQSPFIMENLISGTTYEVFVEAVNSHGAGEDSSRIVFRTALRNIDEVIEDKQEFKYNQTSCCIKSGVKPSCQKLCTYDAKMSDVENLSQECADDFSKVVRCANGGRDHLPCCLRRGVPQACQPMCQAVHQSSTGADYLQCLPFIGQVLTCWEDGSISLPPAVRQVRAVEVRDGVVVLDWKTDESNTTMYEIYYRKVDDTATDGTVFSSDNQLNSTIPRITLRNLEVGKLYQMYVVSRNNNGTSLPSSLVVVNASEAAWDGNPVEGTSSPPHLLELDAHSATWLQVKWNPPAISHPENILKYRLYYQKVSRDKMDFAVVDTDTTSVRVENLLPNNQYIFYATALVGNDSDPNKYLESGASESLISWTDPAFPAFVEAPTIHPIDMVKEGSTMQILCIAMGTPVPTVTVYLNGHPIRSEVKRHMVTNIHNVTKEMNLVSCYADNGYGTPMQASRKITISRPPQVSVSGPTVSHVLEGDKLTIKCEVDAYPVPTLTILNGLSKHATIKSSDRVNISAESDPEDPAKTYIKMTIMHALQSDEGQYYCHAENSLGDGVAQFNVSVTSFPPPVLNVTECCIRQNVTSDCVDVCAFRVDYDTMLRKPHCEPQFHKMMVCATDGSDHRHCCSKNSVPGECLDWCRGEPVVRTSVCAFSHSKSILGCFHEGRSLLPGPPQEIRVQPINQSSVVVTWDAPAKNPESVELYRVFYRPFGVKGANKTDTVERKLVLTNLMGGVKYELVVKAGNSNGTSVLSSPLVFVPADEYFIQTNVAGNRSSSGSVVAGIVIAVFVVIGLIFIVYYVMKKKSIVLSVKNAESPSVSFENPFYSSRNANQQNLQADDTGSVEISNSHSWQGEMQPVSQNGGASPHHAAQDQPTANQSSNPSKLVQALKLGKNNGFQRFT